MCTDKTLQKKEGRSSSKRWEHTYSSSRFLFMHCCTTAYLDSCKLVKQCTQRILVQSHGYSYPKCYFWHLYSKLHLYGSLYKIRCKTWGKAHLCAFQGWSISPPSPFDIQMHKQIKANIGAFRILLKCTKKCEELLTLGFLFRNKT